MAEFGIHVTLIEPGGFETDWRGASARHATPSPVYDAARARREKERAGRYGTMGQGDPAASASALLRVVDDEEPPLRVFFGAAPLEIARREYASRLATWEQWDDVAKLAQG